MAIRFEADRPRASPKNMWLTSSASASRTLDPSAEAPIFFKAPAIPGGLRVNWTAEASARYSRWRETAALMSRAKKTPT